MQTIEHTLTLIGRTACDLYRVDCEDAIRQVCDSVDLPDCVKVDHDFDNDQDQSDDWLPPASRENLLISTDQIADKLAEYSMQRPMEFYIYVNHFLDGFWEQVRIIYKAQTKEKLVADRPVTKGNAD